MPIVELEVPPGLGTHSIEDTAYCYVPNLCFLS